MEKYCTAGITTSLWDIQLSMSTTKDHCLSAASYQQKREIPANINTEPDAENIYLFNRDS